MLATRVLSIKFRYTILGQKYALVHALISYDELKKRYLKTKYFKFRRIEYVKIEHIGKRYTEENGEVRPEYKFISDGDNLLEFSQWLYPITMFRVFRFDLKLKEDSPRWIRIVGDYSGARVYPSLIKQKYIIYDSINFLVDRIKLFSKFMVEKITSYII